MLAALAGASAWVSLGTLAVTSSETLTRVGALPPIWVLIGLVAAAVAAAHLDRLPTGRAWPLSLTLLLWLPWMPVRVPAAMLVFDGHAELLVWAAALLGVAFSGPIAWPDRLRRLVAEPRRAPVAAGLAAAACFGAGAVAIAPQIPAGDEPHYLIITQSLLKDGDLRIENNHRQGDYLSYFDGALPPDYLRRGTDGEIYSIHAPGISAVVLPAFALGGYPAAVLLVILLTAAGTAFAWHAAWLLTGSVGAAWFGWAAVTFAAPVFFHAFTIYPDGTGAALAMFAAWVLVRLAVGGAASVAAPWLAATGTALALLPWLHTRFALVSVGVGAAIALRLLVRPDRLRALSAFAAFPAVGAAGWFLYFRVIYGTFSPASPYGGYTQSSLANLWPGLPGLLADQQFGLFASAPALLAGVIGLVPLARRYPRLAVELLAVGVPYAMAVGSYRMWWGGYSAPARFLVVLLLPLAVAAAAAWRAGGRGSRAGLLALLLASVATLGARTFVEQGRFVYNSRDGRDLLLEWGSRQVNLPLAFPSLHRDPVPQALADAAVWLAVAAMGAGVLVLLSDRGWRRGQAWTATAWTAAVASMLAMTIVWSRQPGTAVTATSSQADFLRNWNPTLQPLTLSVLPTRRVSAADLPRRLTLETTERGVAVGGTRPLFQVPLVPAGRYEVLTDGRSRLSGALDVLVGRTSQRLDHWPVDGRPGGVPGLTLELPVLVHSVTIVGDAAATGAITSLSLRPLEVVPPAGRVDDDYAVRASRYGTLRVFFMDDNVFMEAPGFWTRGGATGVVVLDPDEGSGRSLRLRAGPVPVVVDLEAGDWRETLTLPAGEERVIDPPAGEGGATTLSIHTHDGFRPSEVDARSDDRRFLGVWLEPAERK
ncbi:MAG: hypothetical protein AB7O67_09040 [Vicinamibacterales bacterium]